MGGLKTFATAACFCGVFDESRAVLRLQSPRNPPLTHAQRRCVTFDERPVSSILTIRGDLATARIMRASSLNSKAGSARIRSTPCRVFRQESTTYGTNGPITPDPCRP
jgi:hypothetical protein